MKKTIRHFILSVFTICFIPSILIGQQPPATPAAERLKGYEQRKILQEQSFAMNIPFRSVGPTVFSGRVVDLEVSPDDPTTFYVAYASGGLWKTTNNGTSFESIFDREAVMTIGDIAIDWTNNTIWVGTGENNSSRSSYSGVGIYKSTDDGKSWSHAGLPESHHIGRILLHPSNVNTAWVAVLGHLYSPNRERGIYKTTDGGKTWQQTLFVDENSGGIDLVLHPDDPDILFAAIWHRQRRAWNFTEAGPGSGIYKSTDGGNSWQLISNNDFPKGENTGRIGLACAKNDTKTVLYAVVDNQNRRPDKKEEADKLTKNELRGLDKNAFLKLDEKKLDRFLSDHRFPKKYNAKKVLEMVRNDDIQPGALVEYLEDANTLLFDTPVIGAEVYRSDDEGASWQKTHDNFIDDLFYSYGYYFGQIRVDPSNAERIYIAGVPILLSEDGGHNFKSINGDNVHVDHHALWINPNKPGHLINGNDGGVNISYDNGTTWIKCNSPAVGQFYSVNVDHAEPYNIYGGLQDNGVWVGPSSYKANTRWHGSGHYPYRSIMGGDGMHVEIDPRDVNTVYTGFQFGNYYRLNRTSKQNKYITPKHDLGQRPYRWNWQSPIHLSVHHPDILYIGANKLFRSFNRGDDFTPISDDLTTGGIKGDVAFSTLTSIHESPLQFGLLYVGSDDGLVHVSRDGGLSWTRITTGLPERLWVSRIRASAFEKGRVYLALNGYRWDDFNAYLYRSNDYGTTWEIIGADLPPEPINVVKEDPINPDLLYVGTDHGLYISTDQGKQFQAMMGELPHAPVHDLVIHPRDKELVIGTHGRSFYIADVQHLQQLTDSTLTKELHAFAIPIQRWSARWGNPFNAWRDPSTPKVKLPFFTSSEGDVTIRIKTEEGLLLNELEQKAGRGINYAEYDGSVLASAKNKYEKWLHANAKEEKPKLKEAKNGILYLLPGSYIVEYQKGKEIVTREWLVEEKK